MTADRRDGSQCTAFWCNRRWVSVTSITAFCDMHHTRSPVLGPRKSHGHKKSPPAHPNNGRNSKDCSWILLRSAAQPGVRVRANLRILPWPRRRFASALDNRSQTFVSKFPDRRQRAMGFLAPTLSFTAVAQTLPCGSGSHSRQNPLPERRLGALCGSRRRQNRFPGHDSLPFFDTIKLVNS